MIPPPFPADEQQRLDALQILGILDTPEEERFDRITRLAQRALQVPIALVTLVDGDRQWFKSHQGVALRETPREQSFCGHAILQAPIFVVPDAWQDERFADNPLVLGKPHVRFYAGRPLRSHNRTVGTLCVIDHVPRELSDADRQTLEDLAALVEDEFLVATRDTVDALTGLSNLAGVQRILPKIAHGTVPIALPVRRPGLLVQLDLVGTDSVSRYLGTAALDRALEGFSRTLMGLVPLGGLPARTAPLRFVVALADTADQELTGWLAELRAAMLQAFAAGEYPGRFDFSVRVQPLTTAAVLEQLEALAGSQPLA